ncbi:MAG: NADH-quinone oxidoreductase subunit C [Candidatus Omnitrophica bacterium]|nr:NADH-quinone oxidoreductase subunit C [Candidatus Omnitrophota bacterium]
MKNVAADSPEKQIEIPREALPETARRLVSEGFDNLHCITAVDKKDDIELIYTFYSMDKHACVTVKTRLPLDDLNIESLANLRRSADWLEREVYDLFGVKFLNHPNLKRILNPDDWDVHPLRKDFSSPDLIKKPKS